MCSIDLCSIPQEFIIVILVCPDLVMINISLHEEEASMDEVDVQNRLSNCTINAI